MQIIVPSQHTGIYDKSAVHDFKVKAFIKKNIHFTLCLQPKNPQLAEYQPHMHERP